MKNVRGLLLVLLVTLAASSSCSGGDDGRPPEPVGHAASALSTHTVEIFFNIPDAISSASYTGMIPVTFGVPFEEGVLSLPAELWVEDEFSTVVTSQFDVTGSWPDGSVKWLLIDALVPMTSGSIDRMFFKWDTGGSPTSTSPLQGGFAWTTGYADRIDSSGSAPVSVPPSEAGAFELTMASGSVFDPSNNAVELEREGPVRSVLKSEGTWAHTSGQHVSQYVTRYTVFRDQPFMRVYHTLIWGRDDAAGVPPADEYSFDYDEPIHKLQYLAPGGTIAGTTSIGVDGAPDSSTSLPLVRRQQRVNDVLDDAAATAGELLDGYLSIDRPTGDEDTFVGLRWAAQQFPTGFEATSTDGAAVVLLDGQGPGFTSWHELYIADDVWGFDNTGSSGQWKLQPPNDFASPYGRAEPSPIGLAKTWELWVWRNPDVTVPETVRNAFAQGGVRAYADPAFVTQASLPSPMAPPCTSCSAEEQAVETAIDDLFSFVTRQRNPGEPDTASTHGSLFFGDVIYTWKRVSGNALYRYWLNHGQSFAVLPWMMWMRSGHIDARDFAEAHGRHLMDVDTVHVQRGSCPGNDICKTPGMQGPYSPIPGAFMDTTHLPPQAIARLARKTSESEYLALYYHLTGYERALDVANERVAALEPMWTDVNGGLQQMFNAPELSGGPFTGTENFQHAFRTLGELAILYELSGSSTLQTAGLAWIDAILDPNNGVLQPDGWLPEADANHTWFDHSVLLAARAFPSRRLGLMKMLSRWHDYQGWPQHPSHTGKSGGGQSLWTAAMRYKATGDAELLETVQSAVHAQALAVHDDASAIGSGAGWKGMGPMSDWWVGGAVRDWLAALSLAPFDPKSFPLGYAHRGFQDRETGWWEPNRFYVVKDAGEELHLTLDTAWPNLGDPASRTMRIRTYPPTGGMIEDQYCAGVRSSTFVTSPPGGACPSGEGEAVTHVVDGALTDVGGVFVFDVDIEDAGSPYAGMPTGAKARRITLHDDDVLDLDGQSGSYVELAHHPRFQADENMTVAFRMNPDDVTTLQIVASKRYEYLFWIHSGEIWARYYLDGAAIGQGIEQLHSRKPLPSPGSFIDITSTLAIDPDTGDATVSLCVDGDCNLTGGDSVEGDHITDLPVGYVAHALTHPLTIGRDPVNDQSYFAGQLDDLWIAHRTATDFEKESSTPTGYSSPDWYADAEFVGSGDLLTFDGSFEGISGTTHAVVYGTEGVNYTFATTSGTSKVAHAAELVRHAENRPIDAQTTCATTTGSSYDNLCRLTHYAPGFAGSLHGVSDQGQTTLTANYRGERYTRAWIVDLAAENPSEIATSSFSHQPTLTTTTSAGLFQELRLSGQGLNTRVFLDGLYPLVSARQRDWFDALSCFDPNQVATFQDSGPAPQPDDGYIQYPDFEVGPTYTVSFKMKAPHTAGAKYALNKRYEYRAYTIGGNLYVQHYIQTAYPTLAAPFPENEWVTVTSSVEHLGGGTYDLRLYLNGRQVDAILGVSGTPITNAHPFLIGKGLATDDVTFDGELDDIWVADGLHTGDWLTDTWHTCSTAPSSPHVHETADGSPPTGVTFTPRAPTFP